jgi:hypothetical protein
VFHLIEEQIFGKQDSDRREDFSEVFDIEDSLRKPFLPKSAAVSRAAQSRAGGMLPTPLAEKRISSPHAKG